MVLYRLHGLPYVTICRLRDLAESDTERAAVQRLREWCASVHDLRLASAMLYRGGHHVEAREIARQIPAEA